MPNGGPDCCGTCWFNRRNRGEKGHPKVRDSDEEPYCEIRDVAIEDPFWTYCSNHPHRRPERDPIPIGPIMRNVGDGSNDRDVWMPSPDSEEIRQHLLELLEHFFRHVSERRYPAGFLDELGLVDICLNCDSCDYVIGMINGPGADLGFRSRESGESQSDSARRQPADVTLLTN